MLGIDISRTLKAGVGIATLMRLVGEANIESLSAVNHRAIFAFLMSDVNLRLPLKGVFKDNLPYHVPAA